MAFAEYLQPQSLALLPLDTLIAVLLLSVIIAPVIYRWRARVRRFSQRLLWISVGAGLALLWIYQPFYS